MEGLNLNFQFLDSLIPQSNPILGYSVKSLLSDLFNQSMTEEEKPNKIEQIKNLPDHMALKLCILGNKYGGKRTLAK